MSRACFFVCEPGHSAALGSGSVKRDPRRWVLFCVVEVECTQHAQVGAP